jgi:biopolymer transport protein ExbD
MDTSSLADMGFLLIVFFLITAEIKSEWIIPTEISPTSGQKDSMNRVKVEVLIRSKNTLLVDGKQMNMTQFENELPHHFKQGHLLMGLTASDQVGYGDYIALHDLVRSQYKLFNDSKLVQKEKGKFSLVIRESVHELVN